MATGQVTDPDGRAVVFDASSHMHLAEGRRDWLLDHIDEILIAVQRPDYHEKDPRPGRERFYRENALRPGRWLRVVVGMKVKCCGWWASFVGEFLWVRVTDVAKCRRQGLVACRAALSFEGLLDARPGVVPAPAAFQSATSRW